MAEIEQDGLMILIRVAQWLDDMLGDSYITEDIEWYGDGLELIDQLIDTVPLEYVPEVSA